MIEPPEKKLKRSAKEVQDAKRWRIHKAEDYDVYSLQALARGEADPEQQRHSLKYIVEKICGAYDNTFDLDSERVSSHYQGRQFVGQRIVALLKYNMRKIKEKKE